MTAPDFPLDASGALIVRSVIADLGFTRSMVPLVSPAEWERIARFLFALLDRAPLAGDGSGWAAGRMILGALASDLRTYAHAAGEPVGFDLDLRNATSKAEERDVRQRMDLVNRRFDKRLEEIVA